MITLSILTGRNPSVCRFAAATVCTAFSLLRFSAAASECGVKPLRVDGAPFPLIVGEWTPPGREFPIGAYGARPSVSPTVVGRNRIVVKSVPDAGRDEPIRLAVYSWAPGGALECLPNRDTDMLAGALDGASRRRTADGVFCRRSHAPLVP